MLFGKLEKKGSKSEDRKALRNSQRKEVKTVAPIRAGNIEDTIQRAKKLSHRLLGDQLERIELVTSEDRLREYFRKAIEFGYMGIDTETDSLDNIDGNAAGICLYFPNEKGIYVPTGHISAMTRARKKGQLSPDLIKELVTEANNKGIRWILHNAKFDMHVMYWQYGVLIKPYWDTFTGSCLLNENEPHNLKILWSKYVNRAEEDTELASFNKLFSGMPFTMIPPDVGYMYAGFDPIQTYELFEFQRQFLDPTHELFEEKGLPKVANVFRDIEMPIIETVFDMERNGIRLDLDYADELYDKYKALEEEALKGFEEELAKYDKDIMMLQATNTSAYNKLSNPISIGSPTQIAILLYDILKLKNKSKDKPRGTGVEELNTIDHPLVEMILKYRKVSKLLSTYIDAIPSQVKKKTGRLHGSFNPMGAKTGRFSSSDPNLQNIPSKNTDIRKMFTASEGYYLMGSDYSQQEPRCLAHMSGDEHMIQAYKDGKDLYGVIASKLYNMPYEECLEFRPDGSTNKEGKKRRNSVKPILLGKPKV